MNEIVWKAKWIWKNDKVEANQFAYFRKEVNIGKSVKKAVAYVSAHNHFELFIGGSKVSGYVTPAPSHPEKSKFYLSYDVGSLLKAGINTFCAIVHYIGGGGQNYVDGLPGFILQCEIEYTDNTKETVVTDEEWKALEQTPFANGTGFQQRRKISAIEDYDSTLEDGWLYGGYDDTHWKYASVSPVNNSNWVLKPQSIPEGRVNEIIVPVTAGVQMKGLQIFDAGKIVAGWPRLELPGVKDVKLSMRYSEDITEEGRVKHNVCNEKSENYYDCYRMKGAALETWEPCLSYKAFRYVEVAGYPELLKPEYVKIVSAGTGLCHEGSFNCSNPLLNSIYDACIQTQKNNVLGQMVDCPHREQAQYLADSDLQAETFIYNFSNPEVLKKVLLDFKDGQFDDGRFPFVFPTNINPQFDIKIPEWDLHFCTLLWKIYYYYSDTAILKQCYETAVRMLSCYWAVRDEITGLIPKGKGHPEAWNISDWPYPNIDHSGTALTVQNCLFYHTLGLMSEIAAILGLDNDSKEFCNKADDVRKSITRSLYDPERKLYVDSLGSNQSHQGTNVVAYQYGLVPEEDREAVLDFIVGEGFGCSTLLSLNLLQLLFENNRESDAYRLINRTDYPGWGYMISQGFKTIWEGFKNIESHSHAWNAYPARIFAEYIAGIRALAPGFKRIGIKPYIPEDMEFAEATVPTVNGNIHVRWEKQDSALMLAVSIPENTGASVYIPKPVSGISESGRSIWRGGAFDYGRNIGYCGENQFNVELKVDAGNYLFRAER